MMEIKDDRKHTIEIRLNGRRIIEIYRPEKQIWDNDKIRWAQVNWSACGSVDAAEARDFANAMVEAVKLAYKLNSEFEVDNKSKAESKGV